MTDWILQNKIMAINIAGSRESQSPGIYAKSLDLLEKIFIYVLAHEISEKPLGDDPSQFISKQDI